MRFRSFFRAADERISLCNSIFLVTIQNKKIVYLHKRNFDISNSRHADDRNTNWSNAMLSRDTKNAS